MSIEIGVNMEFIRSQDKSFAVGVERAAKLGYKYVEPMVHNGRELLSEAGYFHSFSLDDDPGEMKDILDQNGVKPSALSAHCPLMRPEISVPYLQKAVRFAAAFESGRLDQQGGHDAAGHQEDTHHKRRGHQQLARVADARREIGALVGSGVGGLHTFQEQSRVLAAKDPDRVNPLFIQRSR